MSRHRTHRGVSRRTLLRSLGLTAGGLFLPSFPGAHAAATGPARRILFYVTSHGTVYDQWRMRQGYGDDRDYTLDLTTLSAGEFSPILQPLAEFAPKMLVLDGLGNGCGVMTGQNEHDEGHASVLTGTLPVDNPGGISTAGGPSLDQVIARQQNTPFPSLEWSLGGWSVNFDDNGQPIPYEGDPAGAWDRLFPNGAPDPHDPSVAERIRARQASVLDLARGRFDALSKRLSGEDRRKLEQHRDLLRDLEQRQELLAELRCEPTDRPIDPWPDIQWGDADYPPFILDQWRHLITAALSCGLTHVLTMRIDHINNGTIGAPPGDLHNDYAHQAFDGQSAAGRIMTDYHTWNASQLAELLRMLDSVPEDGGTLLDHTIVVWTNELATGPHDHHDHPVVIFGGTSVFDTGRYVRWGPTAELQGPWGTTWIGRPHNQLLTTLGNAMGLSLSGFGVDTLDLAGGGTLPTTGTLDRVCL